MMLCISFRATALLLLIAVCCSPLRSQEPRTVGLNEIVVYEPGVHDRGLPKAIFEKIEAKNEQDGAERQRIVIPPAVHVHRYYYSGDKEFQGPIITGGPTVVVANHPKTGDQMLVDVTLPSGAPVIAHNKSGITYVYPDQRVSVKFRHPSIFHASEAVVEHHSGRGVKRRVHEHVDKHVKKWQEHCQKSPAVEAIKSCGQNTKNALHSIGQGACDVAKQVHSTVKAAVSIIPGVSPLLNPPNDPQTQQYRNQVEAAGQKQLRTAPEYVPTIR